MSRFLLNLRKVDSDRAEENSSLAVSTVNFRISSIRNVLGNMGESLEHFPREDDEDVAGEIIDGTAAMHTVEDNGQATDAQGERVQEVGL